MHFNKVVWIAGASSGIGKELAIRLYNKQFLF
jgi:short-subunit dehydrogenase